MPKTPVFLVPRSRQFPFDAVCEEIVVGLIERNWRVDGIKVKFDEYGMGEAKYRLVREVEGDDFRLHFGRPQGSLDGDYNDVAAVSELVIPHQELEVYDDESGPVYYLYVGGDWDRDREWFKHSIKVNSKLYNEPRRYLKYQGRWPSPYIYPDRRAPYLVHDNDLGREYELDGQPDRFNTEKVFESFTVYLRDRILKTIQAAPAPDDFIDPFAVESIPFPDGVGNLFTRVSESEAERIRTGRIVPERLEPKQRYGLQGNGWRLVPLGTHNDHTFPEVAYDGFLECGISRSAITAEIPDEIPGHYASSWEEKYVVLIKPSRANGIYVADMAAGDDYKQSVWEANPEQTRLTNAEYDEFMRVRARTLVPITEYQGNFRKPLVLINRELDLDEVEVVRRGYEVAKMDEQEIVYKIFRRDGLGRLKSAMPTMMERPYYLDTFQRGWHGTPIIACSNTDAAVYIRNGWLNDPPLALRLEPDETLAIYKCRATRVRPARKLLCAFRFNRGDALEFWHDWQNPDWNPSPKFELSEADAGTVLCATLEILEYLEWTER